MNLSQLSDLEAVVVEYTGKFREAGKAGRSGWVWWEDGHLTSYNGCD